jgi:hypothetical protein
MAWVEAAAVFYIRSFVGRIDPFQTNPLPLHDILGRTELIREAATLLMLISIGWLAGHTLRTRLAYSLITFGVWDILYYIFLKLISGWPQTPFDWDILFLLPLPWWGPVLSPMLISILMILGGTIATQLATPGSILKPTSSNWVISGAGVLLALALFMENALRTLSLGEEAIRTTLPGTFNWSVFALALLLMSAPIFDMCLQIRRKGVISTFSH